MSKSKTSGVISEIKTTSFSTKLDENIALNTGEMILSMNLCAFTLMSESLKMKVTFLFDSSSINFDIFAIDVLKLKILIEDAIFILF